MKKNNKKFHTPKRSGLTYLILIFSLVFVILAVFVPISYVTEYKENKVTPFADDITTEVKYGTLDDITDFTLVIKCEEYNDGTNAVFRYYAYKNENSAKANPKNIKLKLAMCSDWIGFDQESSSKSVSKLYDDENTAISSTTSSTYKITISSLPNLPMKADVPFVNIKTIPKNQIR